MDTALLHALNGLAFHHDGLEDPVTLYENAAQMLFLALVVLLVASGGWRRRAGVAAGLGAAVALTCGQIVSRLVDRPRPFVADPHRVHLFARHVADASFPSDHATAAFAIATAVLLRNRRVGAVVLAFAAVLAAGRVAIGVHYPSDVLAGAALGTGASLALYAPAARRRIDALADAVTPALRRLRAVARTPT
jgi:undecaprenyl-diphosphatase